MFEVRQASRLSGLNLRFSLAMPCPRKAQYSSAPFSGAVKGKAAPLVSAKLPLLSSSSPSALIEKRSPAAFAARVASSRWRDSV